MKLTIDTDRKVIEIDQTIKIVDLIEELKVLLGKDWKEYSIEQKWNYWNFPLVTYTTGNGLFVPDPMFDTPGITCTTN